MLWLENQRRPHSANREIGYINDPPREFLFPLKWCGSFFCTLVWYPQLTCQIFVAVRNNDSVRVSLISRIIRSESAPNYRQFSPGMFSNTLPCYLRGPKLFDTPKAQTVKNYIRSHTFPKDPVTSNKIKQCSSK